jgi:hypothetical protein
MADYYPILARAISRLEINNAQARQELYEHARTILIAHLDRTDPKKSSLESISEWSAFEMAVRRVEAKSRSIGERSHELLKTLKNRLDALHKLHRIQATASENGTEIDWPARRVGFFGVLATAGRLGSGGVADTDPIRSKHRAKKRSDFAHVDG